MSNSEALTLEIKSTISANDVDWVNSIQ